MTFQSFENEWSLLLTKVIENSVHHSHWLNTLSFLENCGAKKLAACEHPTKVKEEMLKHAAEEFRHAHYLKGQIHRLSTPFLPDYRAESLLGGRGGQFYFQRLESGICRLLKEDEHLETRELKSLAYLLVTYAIECRAEEVYSIYHRLLKTSRSSIRVHSILLEEREHLAEIEEELKIWPQAGALCREVNCLESHLCEKWLMTF